VKGVNAMSKRLIVLLIASVLVLGLYGSAHASNSERPVGQHFTLVDEQNKIVHQTGMQVYEGDIYITADNSRYQVVEIISANTARCVYQGKETMPDIKETKNASLPGGNIPAAANKTPTIAVYHTHSDESYVPTDGKESIEGNGGIYDVGEVLVNELRKRGFNVQYSKNNHNPHDINAYHRSRRTAAALLKTSPDVILDVHRDAVPASQYQTNVKGEEATKIKLVVGRTNPNMKTNLDFAKRIKAVMDNRAPGLSNGIFIGKGDFNQDLSPRAMLIEVGAHTNNKSDAKNGVQLFADIMPAVLGVSAGQTTGQPATQENQGAWTTILIIAVVVGAAAAGYYFLNRGAIRK
jgi:stage II sporulation protein P